MAGRLFELRTVAHGQVLADGAEFDDDTTVLHWRPPRRGTTVAASLDDALLLLPELRRPGDPVSVVWAEP